MTATPAERAHIVAALRGAASRCARIGGVTAPNQPTALNQPIAGADPVMSGLDPLISARLKRDASGLVPAVVQQHDTGEVLMVAWMNDAALHATLTTGRATYWSRSRDSLWIKGETSGHHQAVVSVALDCDGDTLLVRVDQTGPACHTGERTCFGDVLLDGRAAKDATEETK